MTWENTAAILLALAALLGPIVTLRIGKLESENKKKKDEVDKRVEEVGALPKYAEAWDKIFQLQKEENDKLKSIYENREKQLMEDVESLKAQITQLTNRVVTLEQENQTKDEIIAQLERQLKAVMKKTGPLPDLPQDEK